MNLTIFAKAVIALVENAGNHQSKIRTKHAKR